MRMFTNRAMLAGASAALLCSTAANAALLGNLDFSRFDGTDDAIKDIQKEVKGFGDDFKGLKTSMEKDLADLRKTVEEIGTKEGFTTEIKTQIEKMSASVVEKQNALDEGQKKLTTSLEALETAFKRSPSGNNDAADEKKARAEAFEFFNAQMAAKGQLTAFGLDPEKLDYEGYKSWEGSKGFQLYLRSSDDRSLDQKTLQVGLNPDGGYLVPTARSARIIKKVWESSPLRALATIESIGTSELEIAYDLDEAGAGWVGETQARPATSTPQVGVMKIPVHELYAKPRATQKFLEDASINVEAWLAEKVGDKFARVEASAFITGNGINKPRGILTYPDGSGVRGTITQYPSLSATGITPDALVKMPFLIKSAYLAGASWLMKRSSLMAVMLFKDGQGQYLWRPGLTAGAPSSLLGYDVNMADDMPAVAPGALPVAFGNWKQGYTVVDRLGITTLRDPYSSKPFVEFYTRKRVGGDVTDFEAFILMDIAAS